VTAPQSQAESKTVVWIHGDSLRSTDPALEAHPDAPALFVFDKPFLETVQVAFPRLAFMYQGVRDIATSRTALTEIRVGDALEEMRNFARVHGATQIAATQTVSRRFDTVLDALEGEFGVLVYESEKLTSYSKKVKKFFGFWKDVEAEVLRGETLSDSIPNPKDEF
jgi:hypothetical protein